MQAVLDALLCKGLAPMLAVVVVVGEVSAQEPERRFALVVGNNRGAEDDGVLLRFAEDDAADMAEVLVELGGFAESDVLKRTGESREAIREALADGRTLVSEAAGPGMPTLFLFYYSGHAGPDGLHFGDETLAYADLHEALASVAADVKIVVLDMCHAQAMTYLKGGKRMPPFSVPTGTAGTAYLFSAGADQAAQELRQHGHSLFTHWLLSGMKGSADVSGDGLVTLPELWDYARAGTVRTAAATRIPQEPAMLVRMTGMENVWLARLDRVAEDVGTVEFEGNGDYAIFRSDGSAAGEAFVSVPGQQMKLPAGGYFIRRKGASEVQEAEVEVDGGRTLLLSPGLLQPVAYRGLVDEERSESNWFRSGPEVVVQYRNEVLDGLGTRLGGGLAWPTVAGRFWVTPRVIAAALSYKSEETDISLVEVQPDVSLGYGFEMDSLIIQPRIGAGYVLLSEKRIDFRDSTHEASLSSGGTASAGVALMLTPFAGASYLEAAVEGSVYLLKMDSTGWETVDAIAFTLGVGQML